MDIQARKLVLIEEFLRINDESLIIKLESFIKKEKLSSLERNLEPMTLDKFYGMINQAIQDSDSGRIITHKDLKDKVKKWK